MKTELFLKTLSCLHVARENIDIEKYIKSEIEYFIFIYEQNNRLFKFQNRNLAIKYLYEIIPKKDNNIGNLYEVVCELYSIKDSNRTDLIYFGKLFKTISKFIKLNTGKDLIDYKVCDEYFGDF